MTPHTTSRHIELNSVGWIQYIQTNLIAWPRNACAITVQKDSTACPTILLNLKQNLPTTAFSIANQKLDFNSAILSHSFDAGDFLHFTVLSSECVLHVYETSPIYETSRNFSQPILCAHLPSPIESNHCITEKVTILEIPNSTSVTSGSFSYQNSTTLVIVTLFFLCKNQLLHQIQWISNPNLDSVTVPPSLHTFNSFSSSQHKTDDAVLSSQSKTSTCSRSLVSFLRLLKHRRHQPLSVSVSSVPNICFSTSSNILPFSTPELSVPVQISKRIHSEKSSYPTTKIRALTSNRIIFCHVPSRKLLHITIPSLAPANDFSEVDLNSWRSLTFKCRSQNSINATKLSLFSPFQFDIDDNLEIFEEYVAVQASNNSRGDDRSCNCHFPLSQNWEFEHLHAGTFNNLMKNFGLIHESDGAVFADAIATPRLVDRFFVNSSTTSTAQSASTLISVNSSDASIILWSFQSGSTKALHSYKLDSRCFTSFPKEYNMVPIAEMSCSGSTLCIAYGVDCCIFKVSDRIDKLCTLSFSKLGSLPLNDFVISDQFLCVTSPDFFVFPLTNLSSQHIKTELEDSNVHSLLSDIRHYTAPSSVLTTTHQAEEHAQHFSLLHIETLKQNFMELCEYEDTMNETTTYIDLQLNVSKNAPETASNLKFILHNVFSMHSETFVTNVPSESVISNFKSLQMEYNFTRYIIHEFLMLILNLKIPRCFIIEAFDEVAAEQNFTAKPTCIESFFVLIVTHWIGLDCKKGNQIILSSRVFEHCTKISACIRKKIQTPSCKQTSASFSSVWAKCIKNDSEELCSELPVIFGFDGLSVIRPTLSTWECWDATLTYCSSKFLALSHHTILPSFLQYVKSIMDLKGTVEWKLYVLGWLMRFDVFQKCSSNMFANFIDINDTFKHSLQPAIECSDSLFIEMAKTCLASFSSKTKSNINDGLKWLSKQIHAFLDIQHTSYKELMQFYEIKVKSPPKAVSLLGGDLLTLAVRSLYQSLINFTVGLEWILNNLNGAAKLGEVHSYTNSSLMRETRSPTKRRSALIASRLSKNNIWWSERLGDQPGQCGPISTLLGKSGPLQECNLVLINDMLVQLEQICPLLCGLEQVLHGASLSSEKNVAALLWHTNICSQGFKTKNCFKYIFSCFLRYQLTHELENFTTVSRCSTHSETQFLLHHIKASMAIRNTTLHPYETALYIVKAEKSFVYFRDLVAMNYNQHQAEFTEENISTSQISYLTDVIQIIRNLKKENDKHKRYLFDVLVIILKHCIKLYDKYDMDTSDLIRQIVQTSRESSLSYLGIQYLGEMAQNEDQQHHLPFLWKQWACQDELIRNDLDTFFDLLPHKLHSFCRGFLYRIILCGPPEKLVVRAAYKQLLVMFTKLEKYEEAACLAYLFAASIQARLFSRYGKPVSEFSTLVPEALYSVSVGAATRQLAMYDFPSWLLNSLTCLREALFPLSDQLVQDGEIVERMSTYAYSIHSAAWSLLSEVPCNVLEPSSTIKLLIDILEDCSNILSCLESGCFYLPVVLLDSKVCLNHECIFFNEATVANNQNSSQEMRMSVSSQSQSAGYAMWSLANCVTKVDERLICDNFVRRISCVASAKLTLMKADEAEESADKWMFDPIEIIYRLGWLGFLHDAVRLSRACCIDPFYALNAFLYYASRVIVPSSFNDTNNSLQQPYSSFQEMSDTCWNQFIKMTQIICDGEADGSKLHIRLLQVILELIHTHNKDIPDYVIEYFIKSKHHQLDFSLLLRLLMSYHRYEDCVSVVVTFLRVGKLQNCYRNNWVSTCPLPLLLKLYELLKDASQNESIPNEKQAHFKTLFSTIETKLREYFNEASKMQDALNHLLQRENEENKKFRENTLKRTHTANESISNIEPCQPSSTISFK